MNALIYPINHIVENNIKRGTDDPAISICTYKGILYCKSIEFTGRVEMTQDTRNSKYSAATCWLEATFESLIIDGVPANIEMFSKKELPSKV